METTKSRIIFFTVAITYNLLLGLYLKDFLVLSQALTAFYLLSVLPTFFLLTEPGIRTVEHSKVYKSEVYKIYDVFENYSVYRRSPNELSPRVCATPP